VQERLECRLFATGIYVWYHDEDKPTVLWLAAAMYAVGIAYYLAVARRRLVAAAPEELAACPHTGQ
jgi:hypothetical protein